MANIIATRNAFVEKNYALISSTIRASVYSYLAAKGSKTLRSDEIEDVCSDSMEKVLNRADTYSAEKSSISTWVSTIAVRTLLDALDAKKVRLNRFVRSDDGWETNSQVSYENPTYVNAEEIMIAQQTLEAIDEFKSTLSTNDKVVLDMTERGFKPKEIAEALGKKPSSVYVAKCHILDSLKSTLAA